MNIEVEKQQIRQGAVSWLWLSLLIILLDQASKYLASYFLVLSEPKPLLPFLNLTLAYNTGSAFGFLRGAGGWQGWLFGGIAILVSAFIIFWLFRLPSKRRWLACALALILGGALGNLLDRIVHGYVIDFIDFHIKSWHWPVFNLADSAICIGAVMIVIDVLFFQKGQR